MTESRTVEDRLREEYFKLLPDLRRTLFALDSDVRRHLLPIIINLKPYEQVRIASRLKECESAVDALRRRQEGGGFDPDTPESYSLSALRDLASIRVLVFPSQRIDYVHGALLPLLTDWKSDPVRGIDPEGPPLAPKYYGRCASGGTTVTAEIQIVPSLIGLFWEVEHSALYKTAPELQGVMRLSRMKDRRNSVYSALRDFEIEFERVIRDSPENDDPQSAAATSPTG